MSKRLYELIAKVMNVAPSDISDDSSPESMESGLRSKATSCFMSLKTSLR